MTTVSENKQGKGRKIGRLDKFKSVYLKSKVILASVGREGDSHFSFRRAARFIFSKQGLGLVKKFFVKIGSITINRDLAEHKNMASYQQWRNRHMPSDKDFLDYERHLTTLTHQPLISILVPVYNTPAHFLQETIASVRAQIYPHWELCLADDHSPDPRVREQIKQYALEDPRIKYVFREENGHIAESTNSALQLATGEFCALFDHDDLLTRDALYQMVVLLNDKPQADFIYSDEDKIDEHGNYLQPSFKPQWSPDTLLTRNYLGHLSLLRTSLLHQIGGFRKGFDGSQDYDLYLRFTELTKEIYHIPKVLYHWRMHLQSVAMNTYSKVYAYEAGRKAIEEALVRRGEKAQVKIIDGLPGFYDIRFEIKEYPKVSILIPTKDQFTLIQQCLSSLFEHSTYPDFEVLVIDNGSRDQEVFKLYEAFKQSYPETFFVHSHPIPFNFSSLINFGAAQASGALLLLLNNDTKVIATDWIEAMVENAQRKHIGVVGAQLIYPNDTLQHAGVVLTPKYMATHVFAGVRPKAAPAQTKVLHNYAALTGACLMVRKQLFEELGGFDEELAVEFNDIDFCLRALVKGYFNLYTPYASLYHYESISRGSSHADAKAYEKHWKERSHFFSRWQGILEDDPNYNPNLSREQPDFVSLNY